MHAKIVLDGSKKYDFGHPEIFRDALLQYADCGLFADSSEWSKEDRPYERELRPHVLKHLNFSAPISLQQFLDYRSLAAHRVLLTIYESDFVLLPKGGLGKQIERFRQFYAPERKALGDLIRPSLERHLFSFLDHEIEVTGSWTEPALQEYFDSVVKRMANDDPLPTVRALTTSQDVGRAFRTLAIQLAGDFLVESSAMGRNLLGSYGPEQSELFKVMIDEYGYGVHGKKHSTLYENLLRDIGLTNGVHDYWQFYLTSSLALNNYYNYISRSHSLFFRYVGAIFQAETAFIRFCRQVERFMREHYPRATRAYFAEHAHIDIHHSSMVLERLVKPVIEKHGPQVISEIVKGFESAQLLSDLAERDFVEQVAWMDAGPVCKELHDVVYPNLARAGFPASRQVFTEPFGELSVTHVHDGDELCHIESGVMHFVNGSDSHVRLEQGQGTVIRKNRLHGAIIDSDQCVYTIHSIGDHRRWL
jgi:hypothetical protein